MKISRVMSTQHPDNIQLLYLKAEVLEITIEEDT